VFVQSISLTRADGLSPSSQEGKLDAHIDEGGTNFSAGQRQLICLGVRLIDRVED
jgi:ABC-type multidrug transport system fused ATPase/permease subunit